MTAEAASDGDAPRAAANGEAAKHKTGPGSPVARRGGPRAPRGPVAEPSAKPRGRGRGSAASRKHGHETVVTVGGLALLLQVIVLIVN